MLLESKSAEKEIIKEIIIETGTECIPSVEITWQHYDVVRTALIVSLDQIWKCCPNFGGKVYYRYTYGVQVQIHVRASNHIVTHVHGSKL